MRERGRPSEPRAESREPRAGSEAILDAHVREIVRWHFSPETGCPFWLAWAAAAGWDPAREVEGAADLVDVVVKRGRIVYRRAG